MRQDFLYFKSGRFIVRFYSPIKNVKKLITSFYTTVPETTFFDFDVKLIPAISLSRSSFFKVRFIVNGHEPFSPLPLSQAYPLLEWGLNWATSYHFHEALVIHAAVVEKQGKAMIMPGLPGSGKSTLCAALVYGSGWRLLSDELTIFDSSKGDVLPNPRPISLKDKAIDIIKTNFNVSSSPVVRDTQKGSVAHFPPPESSLSKSKQTATASIILFPKYNPNLGYQECKKYSLNPADCFLEVADNSFNYSILGVDGFYAIKELITHCQLIKVEYGGCLKTISQLCEELLNEH